MRIKLLLIPFLLLTGMGWGQVINGENITIDASVSIENIESNVKKVIINCTLLIWET
ncbi:hypothetical protein [Soonwooa purpurea]